MGLEASPKFWDAHIHLPAYPLPDQVVASAEARSIGLLSVTVSPEEAVVNIKLRQEHPSTVRCFLGVHPSEATETSSLDGLAGLWEEADGVGEVGLDPKYSAVAAHSAQLDLFKEQVGVAERLKKPLQVHSRDAEVACLDVLESASLGSVLLHWFQSDQLLARALSLPRSFFSFGPAILYSKRLSRIAARCPHEALLVESDGPVPFAALGGAEGAGLTPSVILKVAELWGGGLDEAVEQLSQNMERYLRQQG